MMLSQTRRSSSQNIQRLQRSFRLDLAAEVGQLVPLHPLARPGMMPPFSVPDYVLPRPKAVHTAQVPRVFAQEYRQ